LVGLWGWNIPEGALGANGQILEDEPEAEFASRVGQAASIDGVGPNQITRVILHIWRRRDGDHRCALRDTSVRGAIGIVDSIRAIAVLRSGWLSIRERWLWLRLVGAPSWTHLQRRHVHGPIWHGRKGRQGRAADAVLPGICVAMPNEVDGAGSILVPKVNREDNKDTVYIVDVDLLSCGLIEGVKANARWGGYWPSVLVSKAAHSRSDRLLFKHQVEAVVICNVPGHVGHSRAY
jgi:hypothetical protein